VEGKGGDASGVTWLRWAQGSGGGGEVERLCRATRNRRAPGRVPAVVVAKARPPKSEVLKAGGGRSIGAPRVVAGERAVMVRRGAVFLSLGVHVDVVEGKWPLRRALGGPRIGVHKDGVEARKVGRREGINNILVLASVADLCVLSRGKGVPAMYLEKIFGLNAEVLK
jgi:hypothetical protein